MPLAPLQPVNQLLLAAQRLHQVLLRQPALQVKRLSRLQRPAYQWPALQQSLLQRKAFGRNFLGAIKDNVISKTGPLNMTQFFSCKSVTN
jgi:hypothetical protein